ncbi:MAG: hypothetical protein ABI831_06130 [Betaproteobacteria bacterium]
MGAAAQSPDYIGLPPPLKAALTATRDYFQDLLEGGVACRRQSGARRAR